MPRPCSFRSTGRKPFGLVMIEAMACGTPVIAFRSGSVPEVVDHGVSGFIVDEEAEAVQAISRLAKLDRRKVRRQFEKRFTARRMAEEYLQHYQTLVQARPQLMNRSRIERVPRQIETSRPSSGELL
jgi:glycosyltransferase involved in cell wall biosynthesis